MEESTSNYPQTERSQSIIQSNRERTVFQQRGEWAGQIHDRQILRVRAKRGERRVITKQKRYPLHIVGQPLVLVQDFTLQLGIAGATPGPDFFVLAEVAKRLDRCWLIH